MTYVFQKLRESGYRFLICDQLISEYCTYFRILDHLFLNVPYQGLFLFNY